MTIVVHTVSGAPRPWRVLLGLTFKSLDYEIRYLENSKGELKSKTFMEINPRGTVPVLEEGPIRICDSIGSLAWLDRAYPERPLFGSTSLEAANIWQMTTDFADHLRAACHRLLWPILVEGIRPPSHQSKEYGDLKAAADGVLFELEVLARHLSDGRRYLAGDSPTAADAIAFPEVRLLERAIDQKHDIMDSLGLVYLESKFKQLIIWKRRIAELPGFEQTMPRHW